MYFQKGIWKEEEPNCLPILIILMLNDIIKKISEDNLSDIWFI